MRMSGERETEESFKAFEREQKQPVTWVPGASLAWGKVAVVKALSSAVFCYALGFPDRLRYPAETGVAAFRGSCHEGRFAVLGARSCEQRYVTVGAVRAGAKERSPLS